MCSKKGPNAQKLFWELIKTNPQKSSGVEALKIDGIITTDTVKMAQQILF